VKCPELIKLCKKKRARRRALAEINAHLISDPDLNRAVVENNNGRRLTSSYAPLNTAVRSTGSTSEVMHHITPVSMQGEPDSPSAIVEQEKPPIERKDIILEALATMRKEIDKISSCVEDMTFAARSQNDTDTTALTDDTHTPKLIKSDADSGIGEMTREERSDVSDPRFFICMHCETPRSVGLKYDGICVYCLDQQQRFCIEGNHEAGFDEYFDDYGNETDACNYCRAAIESGSIQSIE